VSTTIRLDADIIAAFRQQGEGWQTRVNAALRDWLDRHRQAGRGRASQKPNDG